MVLAKVAFCIAEATHEPSAGSGLSLTVTLVTAPPPETFTETVTLPLADDLAPQAVAFAEILPTPAEMSPVVDG